MSANNYVVAVSAEGYVSKSDALRGIEIAKSSAGAPVKEFGRSGVVLNDNAARFREALKILADK